MTDDIKNVLKITRDLVYETLRDAQAIARNDHSRFRNRDTRKADPNRKTRAARLHPNVILGRAKRELHDWIYSTEFYHHLVSLEWEDPVGAIKKIEEFARGNHAKELDSYLEKYRSLKQGHAGRPLNRSKNHGQQTQKTDRNPQRAAT